MLDNFFHTQLSLGIAQAGVTLVLALSVILLTRWQSIRLGGDIIVSLLRGLVQVVLVGTVLVFILQGPLLVGGLILLVMVFFAAMIAARRSRNLPGAFQVSLYGILLGAGMVIGLMTWIGVIERSLTSLIPVGSMIVANAMNACSLALDRFEAEVKSHVGQIEAGLSLGASPAQVVKPYVQFSFRASLLPNLNSMRSLGIVWIPGLMAGMILAGEDPIYSAFYQFVVVGMIFIAAGLASLTTTLIVRRFVFSAADQLLVRPEGSAAP
jgi:putative ABC transport system permease protein